MSETFNNYEVIRLKYGEEVAKILDQADGEEDKNISQENLSIFNAALTLLHKEKKDKEIGLERADTEDKWLAIKKIAPWARGAATKALNYFNSPDSSIKKLTESLSKIIVRSLYGINDKASEYLNKSNNTDSKQ